MLLLSRRSLSPVGYTKRRCKFTPYLTAASTLPRRIERGGKKLTRGEREEITKKL